MAGIMFPAYQKFYSAVSNLERFCVENCFFDNISCLDNFLSEYRNITFVLQKSIAHTDKKEIYIKNRDKYLEGCHWFVKKRNEVIKEKPFELEKHIDITKYYPDDKLQITYQRFTVESDETIEKLLNEVKEYINESTVEVFFSVVIKYYEKDNEDELFEKIIPGISIMSKFLKIMYDEIGEDCSLSKDLMNKTDKLVVKILSSNLKFSLDYIYYPEREEFERGTQMQMIIPGITNQDNFPLSKFLANPKLKGYGDLFEKFMILNLCIGKADLMPTFILIYRNNKVSLESFNSDIKTTFYRKINEVAALIKKGTVKEVIYMLTYTTVDFSQTNLVLSSKERIDSSLFDTLVFIRMNEKVQEECSFDGRKINDMSYIRSNIKNCRKKELYYGINNMRPILKAFKKL